MSETEAPEQTSQITGSKTNTPAETDSTKNIKVPAFWG